MKNTLIILLPIILFLSCCKDPEPVKPIDNTPKSKVVFGRVRLVSPTGDSVGTYNQNKLYEVYVTLSNTQSGFTMRLDASGVFKFNNVPHGLYTLSIFGTQFKSYKEDSIQVKNLDTSYIYSHKSTEKFAKVFAWKITQKFYMSVSGFNVVINNNVLRIKANFFGTNTRNTTLILYPEYIVTNNRKLLNYWYEFGNINKYPEIEKMLGDYDFIYRKKSLYYGSTRFNPQLIDDVSIYKSDESGIYYAVNNIMETGDTLFVKAVVDTQLRNIISNDPVVWCLKE